MTAFNLSRSITGIMLVCTVAARSGAQLSEPRDSLPTLASAQLALIGSPSEDRRRLDEIVGRRNTSGSLIRSLSASSYDTTLLSWRQQWWSWVLPYGELSWSSRLPFSINDGPQWAGRGLTVVLAGGLRARMGPLSLNLVPEVWHAQNRPFVVLPAGDTSRSSFSSPWHVGVTSADLPLRFGYAPLTAFDLGESALWITKGGVAAGLATESQWWGPGLRNAIVMSNNAGGIPHAFVRTASPIRTRVGDLEGRWMVGGLTESRFFDENRQNDLRSLSGAVFTFTPRAEPNLSVGLSRVVYAPIRGRGALTARALDVFARWGIAGNVRADTGHRGPAEQLTAAFGRWIFPVTGMEAYAEWSRIVLPTSIQSFLLAPQFTQGFTVGGQWTSRESRGARMRFQLEFTDLEQSPPSRLADTLTYYVSRAVPQGYTQRGQIVGAAIGPGASSQWMAFDRITSTWTLGAFAGRIRWEQDTYYLQPTSVSYYAYDMTLFSGLRGSWRRGGHEITADVSLQRRYNYLFQNSDFGYSRDGDFDQRNVTLKIRAY